MEVTLTFVNATTPVNANIGIFNNVATHTMVNYVDTGVKATINDKSFEKAGYVRGDVKWKRVWDEWDLKNITADYLIICSETFYPRYPWNAEPHPDILALANHRAQYNGFNVMILSAEDIISDDTELSYEGNPNDPDPQQWDRYKKEQRIRTCIRMIYETGTAHHTMDGKLGYVLLVGDVDDGNTGMPTSYDHKELNADFYGSHASDYYFSCITKDASGIYDPYGDVFIGRFCVPNNLNTVGNDAGLTRLHNMVTKTIDYEQKWDPYFKGRVNLAYGGELAAGGGYYGDWFTYIASIMQSPNISGVNAYAYNGNQAMFRNEVINMLNSSSIGMLFAIHAHGNVDHWWGNLSTSILQQNWVNPNQQPFCVSTSCLTGKFDDHKSYFTRCLAEDMTSYSDTLGFIGMLAAASEVS
jgi:hypothetical protein